MSARLVADEAALREALRTPRGDAIDGPWQLSRREAADLADALLASGVVQPREEAAREAYVKEASGPGWFWTQGEWAEWSNELAMLIPEGDESIYSNPDGAQESIILDCLRAYVAERAALADDPAQAALARVEALTARWEREAVERGPNDKVNTAGVASMLRAALVPGHHHEGGK